MMRYRVITLLWIFSAISVLEAQDIQVNRQNKTIAVTAEESVIADPELATLAIGYRNFAATQDQAFADNVKFSNEITKKLLASGVPKENIETEKLSLGRAEVQSPWTPEMKKDRQFEAQQSWQVTVPVAIAQSIVDLAVRTGANEVDDVDWSVVNPLTLQAKASGAALTKARAIADQMAKGLGAQLGGLVYASNRAPVAKILREAMQVDASTVEISPALKVPKLTLFPQKVTANATVYAVFSIE